MAAIAMAESSGNNVIQQGQPYSSTGWGLWQITPGNSVASVGTDQALLNPVNNAKAAFIKWKGQGLGAWTTYTSGAYRQFLPAGSPPPPANDGSSGGGGTGSAPPAANAGILGDITGVTALTNSLEHIFDVTANNLLYAGLVLLGGAAMAVGIVIMVKESPAGTSIVNTVKGAAGTVAKVAVK